MIRVGFPYHHNLSHRLKSIEGSLEVELVASIKDKYESLPKQVEMEKKECKVPPELC
jgi:hypothetical protein